MFVWGSGHKQLQVEFNDAMPCPACKRSGARLAVIEYDYNHIFWLFKGLKNQVASVKCTACGGLQVIDKYGQKSLFVKLGRNPIPFMDRFGAGVLLAIVVGWFAFALSFPCAVNPSSRACLESKAPLRL